MAIWFLALILLGSPSPSPSPSPARDFFKEDHYTGADYLALDGSGRYELVGREHMGVWVLERGTWRSDGEALAFAPEEPREKRPYTGVRVMHDGHLFLVWSGDKAAGMVVPAEDVKRDLAKGEGLPPYVFFRIPEEVFRKETGITYPFKFYPEINQQKHRPRREHLRRGPLS